MPRAYFRRQGVLQGPQRLQGGYLPRLQASITSQLLQNVRFSSLSSRATQRYKICREHCSALQLQLEGAAVRFCQQCGHFQPLKDFDGIRRTCRRRLEAHNSRRKRIASGATDDHGALGLLGSNASSDSTSLGDSTGHAGSAVNTASTTNAHPATDADPDAGSADVNQDNAGQALNAWLSTRVHETSHQDHTTTTSSTQHIKPVAADGSNNASSRDADLYTSLLPFPDLPTWTLEEACADLCLPFTMAGVAAGDTDWTVDALMPLVPQLPPPPPPLPALNLNSDGPFSSAGTRLGVACEAVTTLRSVFMQELQEDTMKQQTHNQQEDGKEEEEEEGLIRVSLKMHDVEPWDLTQEQKESLSGSLASGLEAVGPATIRPGCVHVTLDLLVKGSEAREMVAVMGRGKGGVARAVAEGLVARRALPGAAMAEGAVNLVGFSFSFPFISSVWVSISHWCAFV
jgi:hypothetical protein